MKNSFALVTVIIGTRPEAIKLSPVIKAFQLNSFFKVRVVLTGQHKELVDEVLNVFNIKYDFNINLMSSKQSLNNITVKILYLLSIIFESEINKNKNNTNTNNHNSRLPS